MESGRSRGLGDVYICLLHICVGREISAVSGSARERGQGISGTDTFFRWLIDCKLGGDLYIYCSNVLTCT